MNHQTDQTKLERLQNRIRARKGLIGCGEKFSVALHSSGKLVYAGTDRWGQEEAREWANVLSFACGAGHIVVLLEDGTLRMAGYMPVDEEALGMLSCVRTVATGQNHVAALLGNGHTVAIGEDRYGQCHTENWPNMTDVVCGLRFTAGLTASGHVYVTGGSRMLRHTVRSWQNVAGIFTDHEGLNVYAITADGKLLSTANLPRKAEKWKNLVYVAAYRDSVWAVTANGQLVSTDDRVEDMSETKHYIVCDVSRSHLQALTRDGRILTAGKNDFGQCNTARMGEMYADFDEFSADRLTQVNRMMARDREYQVRMANAKRYKRHLVCGKGVTVCINAEGRVLSTAGNPDGGQGGAVRAVACGNAHIVMLHENGRVSADGNHVDGCTHVSDWENVKAIAAGEYHSLGLTEDGRVLFCGRNRYGQGDVTDWTRIGRLATTDRYTVGITYDGDIRIAGTPPFDPSLVDESWRAPIQISVAATHLVCLYADGTVKSTAHPTEDWRGVRAIETGRDITLGLCYGGRVLAVGNPAYGQCDTSAWRSVVDIGCGDRYVVGLTADGRLLLAGDLSALRSGETMYLRGNSPDRWKDVMAIRCGAEHMIALAGNGQILSCGSDQEKQCTGSAHFTIFRDVRQLYGYGQYSRQIEMEIQAHRDSTEKKPKEKATPLAVRSPAEAAPLMRGRFDIGMGHVISLSEKGTIHTGGANDCGQGELTAYESAVQVAAGPYRSAAILSDGRIMMAGLNDEGQGDAHALNRELESTLDPSVRSYAWLQVSCGYTHTAALRSDGRVFAIGASPDGRCDTLLWRDVAEVVCGIRHTVACKKDGTCMAVGDDRYGQCNLQEWRDICMVAAGEFHTVALTSDGRVMAVGDNRKGQCEVEDLTDIISVACTPESTLCLRADGHVVIRGGSGEFNRAVEALQDIAALATCEHRIAAMSTTGEIHLIPS